MCVCCAALSQGVYDTDFKVATAADGHPMYDLGAPGAGQGVTSHDHDDSMSEEEI